MNDLPEGVRPRVRIPDAGVFGRTERRQKRTERRLADVERTDGAQYGQILKRVRAVRDEVVALTTGLAEQVQTYIGQYSRTRSEIDSKNSSQDSAIAGKENAFGVLTPGKGGTGTTNAHDQTWGSSHRAVYVNPSGMLTIGASSARYKQDIALLDVDLDALLTVPARRFRWRAEVDATHDATALQGWDDDGGTPAPVPDSGAPYDVGLIAEEAADAGLDWLVHRAGGRPEAVLYSRLPIAHHELLRRQARELADLQTTVAAQATLIQTMSARITALEERSPR